jgi:hypothetical protein
MGKTSLSSVNAKKCPTFNKRKDAMKVWLDPCSVILTMQQKLICTRSLKAHTPNLKVNKILMLHGHTALHLSQAKPRGCN